MIVRELVNLIGFKIDEQGLKSVEKRVQGLATNLKKVGTAMTVGISVPLAALAVASIKASGNIERMTTSFTVFLGSSEKALSFVKDLIDFAAKTPLQIGNLEAASTILLGYGVAADKLIPTLRMVGDATRGNNELFQRAVLAIGQIKGATVLRGQELRQLVEAQVNILPYLAKVTGHSTKAIVSDTARLGITYEQVVEALKLATSEGGTYFNLLEKQAGTLFGSLTTLKDSFNLLLVKFGDMIDATFKVRQNLRKLISFVLRLTDWFSQLTKQQKTLITSLTAMLGLLGPLILSLSVVLSLVTLLNTNMFLIVGVIGLVSAAIALLIQDFIVWKNGGESIIGGFVKVIEAFLNKLTGGATRTFILVKDTFSSLLTFIGTFFQAVFFLFFGSTEKAKEALTNFGVATNHLLGNIGALLIDVVLKILDAVFSTVWNKVTGFFDKAMNYIKGQIKEFLNLVNMFSSDSLDNLAGKLIDKIPGLSNIRDSLQANFGSGPAASLATSGATSSRSVNVNSTITVSVPEGTPEEQRNYVERSAKDAVSFMFNRELNHVLASNPENE